MYEQTPNSLYSRYSRWRKTLSAAIVSWTGLVLQVSSTSVLSALPEIGGEHGTEGRVIALSNALNLVYGRKWTGVVAVLLTLACSIGTALSPTIASFFAFRILTALFGYVLNPRFALTSPTESGLFYLAPGIGYLTGTLFGGRWADRVVRRWVERRHGNRVPEDRVRSCLLALGIALPGCMLVYGWTVDRAVGGIAVPVIAMFLGGVSQLLCFPSLNTYCLDVLSGRGSEVMAGHPMVWYFFGAGASALVLPAVSSIGVGWFSTIAAGQMVLGAVALLFVTMYGREWRVKLMA
ncbi:uncharacterized protein J7T54_004562 [Emericellopsis cladophorae]|uniref:Major facilitator superfamily (MFS) profile domain-containing protein n=1 Tax=Emericellopsis cladophorae TaxID=2686198 RepID=A0A9P9Y5T4_9HYPO|nr:uncharacterized protein J7T54_004562 [Emericellopsis cladophorae]KAI6784016.1 hypothetical protein J7T54_004562 [Emericellopsis cladophorae]